MFTHNGSVLKRLTYNGQVVKRWYHNGKLIFSDDVVLLDTGDNMTDDSRYRWYVPADLEGVQSGEGYTPANYTSIDCTGYNYCKVRVYAQDHDVTPSGGTQNNFMVYLGFTDTYSDGIKIAHKSVGTAMGTWTDGEAYNQWADIVIDISALNGIQTLNVMGHRDCHGGTGYFNVWLSKITMYN